MDPKKMSNDTLALGIDLWAKLNEDLTEVQKSYFEEVVWRLRLMNNKEQENSNG